MHISDRPPPPGFLAATPRSGFTGNNGPWYEKHEGGTLLRAFRVLDKHVNALGIAHGGMLMAFADSVLARAAFAETKRSAVTMRMTCDFVGPARLGDWVEGSAELTRATRHLAFVRGRIWTGNRTVLTATAVFSALRARPDRTTPERT